VESNRLRRWYRPGLLLIGDAAHAMSPIGGVGINYAIQDAVVAANVLAGPLASGWLRLRDLAEVQRQRELPTRLIQGFQHVPQRRCSLAPFSYCAGPLLVVRDAVASSTETTSGGGGMGTPCRPLRDVLTETGDCRAARGKHHPLAAIVCLLTVYGVSSLGAPRADAARVLRRPRPRWRIENRSHWVRAASVDEAHSQVRWQHGSGDGGPAHYRHRAAARSWGDQHHCCLSPPGRTRSDRWPRPRPHREPWRPPPRPNLLTGFHEELYLSRCGTGDRPAADRFEE